MKVLYKILAGILSLISFAAFLLVASLFASYYIDALSFVYHSDKVVKDACIFAAVTILALIVLICIIVSAIKAKRHYLSAIVALVLVIVLAFPMFFTGLALIIINGTNGCSYTEDAANYGKYDGKYSPEHFPESITEDMSVVV